MPNAAGFAALGVRKGSIPYTVEGAGAAIVARPLTAGAPRLEGLSLVDLVFELRDAFDRRYTLRIAATDTTRFWARPQESSLDHESAARVGDDRPYDGHCGGHRRIPGHRKRRLL